MKKAEKEYLYHILNEYLNDKITLREFADEFYYCYGKELDYDTLTDKERLLFEELSRKLSRYSEFVEDDINYPGTYFTDHEVDEKIKEVIERLK